MNLTVELGGVLAVGFALLCQSAAVIWWASRMTQTLASHSDDLKTLFVLHTGLKDKVSANEEAALNREIDRLQSENKELRGGK
jgi:hypothetical protein